MYFITPDMPSVKPFQLKIIMPRLHGVGRILMALVCPSVCLMPDPKSRAKVLGSWKLTGWPVTPFKGRKVKGHQADYRRDRKSATW